MGKAGPPPKPMAVKIAEGNPGHQKLNQDIVKFSEGEPDMPQGMSPGARKQWKKFTSMLSSVPGLLTLADGWALANLCEVQAQMEEIETVLNLRTRREVTAVMADLAKENANLKEGEQPLKLSKKEILAEASQRVRCENHAGKLRRHPLVVSQERLRGEAKVLYRNFGLDPAGRNYLRLPVGSQDKAADALDDLYTSAGPVLVKNAG